VTRSWYAETVVKTLFSQKANKSFSKKKDLKMNHKGVRHAEQLRSNNQEATEEADSEELKEKCTQPFALSVAKKQQCHLSQQETNQYTVKIAFKLNK
jgi:hypothetical protein